MKNHFVTTLCVNLNSIKVLYDYAMIKLQLTARYSLAKVDQTKYRCYQQTWAHKDWEESSTSRVNTNLHAFTFPKQGSIKSAVLFVVKFYMIMF